MELLGDDHVGKCFGRLITCKAFENIFSWWIFLTFFVVKSSAKASEIFFQNKL
jgi:hypothetical protein